MSTNTEISRISCNKSRKTDRAEKDFISNLPDCVISHILSCLPMKDVVRTSVLSKYWEYKWTSIHEIVLDEGRGFMKYGSENANFGNFVERTLLLSPNFQRLSITCYRKYDLRRWITAALSRNLHCLHIDCRDGENFVLPRNLLHCYSLRELHLAVPCTFKVPTKTYFHNLTSLELISVRILNEQSDSDRVEFRFPLLEKLDIFCCEWLNIKFVEINAPKLAHLSLLHAFSESHGCSFKITGDSLVKFSCFDDSFQTNVVLSGSAVVHAKLESFLLEGDDLLFLEKNGLRFRNLLKGFPNLKHLELYGHVAEAMVRTKRGLLSLPMYYNMQQLVLEYFYATEALFELLHATPYLKLLDIRVEGMHDYDAEESVPSCIISHLEKVKFSSYTWETNEVKLVKFFLKNSVQLRSMQLYMNLAPSRTEKEWRAMEKELRRYPRASAHLTISVDR